MKIAVLGSGGREHAISWKLSQVYGMQNVYSIPGNGGTLNNIPLSVMDFEKIKDFCECENVRLLVVGPETPLISGISDYFEGSRISVFGPGKDAAKLEGSKIWAKGFMTRNGVKTSEYEVLDGIDEQLKAVDAASSFDFCVAVKYDGLAEGKGVAICQNEEDFMDTLTGMYLKFGNNMSFLIEKCLSGFEVSIIVITDGKSYKMLMPSQDHKRLKDGDEGPNTGGMGVFSPVPACDGKIIEEIKNKIIEPTMNGLAMENLKYRGVLYFGVMVTDKGPYLLEYNVRFGDPEAQVLLPMLKSDLGSFIMASLDGSLDNMQLEFEEGYYVDVVLASGGYPGKPVTGYEISGLDTLLPDTYAFHSGTKREGDSIYTSGGRVLNIVASGLSGESAMEKVYSECEKIRFKDMFYRKDIGRCALMRTAGVKK